MRQYTFILRKLQSQLNVVYIRGTVRSIFKESILGFYFIQLIVEYSKVQYLGFSSSILLWFVSQ